MNNNESAIIATIIANLIMDLVLSDIRVYTVRNIRKHQPWLTLEISRHVAQLPILKDEVGTLLACSEDEKAFRAFCIHHASRPKV